MVYKETADPYMSKEIEKNVEGLRGLVKSTMEQVHSEYLLNNKELTDEMFQSEVISQIKESLQPDFFNNLDNAIRIWTDAREGIIKQYFKERTNYTVPKRYLEVAVKCNSLGGSDVLIKDLEPWLDKVNAQLNPINQKYLRASATRKLALSNLKNMLEFPVSVKETELSLSDLEKDLNPLHLSEKEISPFYLTENEIYALININPGKYLPGGALKLLTAGAHLEDVLFMTANVIEYKIKDDRAHKEKTVKCKGRVKSLDAMKYAKYDTGIRTEAHYDGIGIMEIVENILDIKGVSEDILLLNNKKKRFNLDLRFPFPADLSKTPTGSELRQAYAASEIAVMELLKKTYLTREGGIDKDICSKFKPGMVYGNWIDMNPQFTKGPVEVQVKDVFGYLLYGFNSPFGHNSKAYHKVRMDELHKKVKISGREYSVDKITEYIANDVLLPAFTKVGRLY